MVPKSRGEVPFLHSFLAGNFAGICGLTLSYPFDTVKVRLQTQPGTYSSLFNCFSTMLRQEGFFAFYRGLPSPALGYGAINAVAFSTKESVASFLRPSMPDSELTLSTFGGMAAGVTSGLIRGPIERVKTIMQHSRRPDGTSPYKSTLHCCIETSKTQSVRSLMAGTYSTITREVLQYAVYYPSYAFFKIMLTPEGQENPSRPMIAVCGALAGMAQWFPPSYCVDVVKSRIQAEPERTYRGMMDCARRSYQAEGTIVFFRGLSPALIRAIPLHGTIFLAYEVALDFFRRRSRQADHL